MSLQPLKIVKNWFTDTKTREENYDEIVDNIQGFATRTNNNLKQIGLDLNGSVYDFNNVGKSTQTTSVISRITTLESQSAILGTRNLGLDLSVPSKVKIVGSDGSNLSSINSGLVAFNATSNGGQLVTRTITSNIEVTLTGAHWGFDTGGDLTDVPLWVMFLDTGATAILAVAAQGGRASIAAASADTAVGNITTFSKVLTSSTPAGTLNAAYLGWVKADFDDTGNAGGENFWTLQSSFGDVNIGPVSTLHFGDVRF